MKTRTLDLANEWGLDIVEVTQGVNGYPKGLYKAVTGFDFFENAEDFAEQIDGYVTLLSRRDGHEFYANNGRAYEGIERAKFIDEEKEEVFESELGFEEWCAGEIARRLDVGFNLFEFRDMVDQMSETYVDVQTRCRSEIAIVDTNDYTCRIEEKYVTEIHDNDVTTYIIAVVDYETDEG